MRVIKFLRQLLRAGLQHGSTTSQPQLGAASQHVGAGAAQHVGAGAGAAQHVGAGAGAAQHGAGASQHVGAGSQQEFFGLLHRPASIPFSFEPNFGLQTGAASQQVSTGASQHTGAGSQQESFLQNKPALALDEKLAQATTVKVTMNRRISLTPK